MTSIALRSATALRDGLATGELRPTEVVEACAEQIARWNPTVNAVVTLNERAIDDATALEKAAQTGTERGPLYGLPVGVKDVTPVAGMRTTYGSPLYADNVAEADSEVVARLKRAGAIVIGKTNTPEFAAGGNTFNEVFGRTHNPWDPTKSAGGSTGGGAVGLATGMFAIATGTDLGGSLRIPASFCGVVGLRPSVALVPHAPSPFLWDTLQVDGAMGRTAEDVAMVLEVLAGASPQVPLAQPRPEPTCPEAVRRAKAEGLRIAYCPDLVGIGIDAEVEHVTRHAAFALREQGAIVEEIELDLAFGRPAFQALRGLWMLVHHRDHLDRLGQLGPNVRGNVELGLTVSALQLADAERARTRLWHMFEDLFARYDHLVTPAMAVSPFPVTENYPATVGGKQMDTYIDWIAPTFVLSLTGLPVASAPCGLDRHGLPAGLQIVGRARGDSAVLGLAKIVSEQHPIGRPVLPE